MSNNWSEEDPSRGGKRVQMEVLKMIAVTKKCYSTPLRFKLCYTKNNIYFLCYYFLFSLQLIILLIKSHF